MGQCFLYGTVGGGSGMWVVIKAEAPTNPRENTVWVKSDTAGKKYVFAEAEPEAAEEGMLWLSVTGKGIITSASVYSGGKWVLVDAYMFIGGQWVPIASSWDGRLFDNGDQIEAVTGGWVGNSQTFIDTTLSLRIKNSRPLVSTNNVIDLSLYRKLHCIASWGPDFVWFGIAATKNVTAQDPDWIAYRTVSQGEAILDISSVQSGYVQCFAVHDSNATVDITKIWLE